MKDDYIKLPRTEDNINHVARHYLAVGHPGCIGSIGCVHIGWNASKHTLKVQCTNNGSGDAKGNPSVVFEVTSTHNKNHACFVHVLGCHN
jgi:hypothetical protein